MFEIIPGVLLRIQVSRDVEARLAQNMKALFILQTLAYQDYIHKVSVILHDYLLAQGTAEAQWLRCCATNRKVAGSIPDGVIGIGMNIKSFRSHYGHGFDSASNRNAYQEHFLGVKAAGA